MVFLIQNTQNRDTMALQLELSELIIAMKGAKNSLATVEDLSEEELEELHKELCARADAANKVLTTRRNTAGLARSRDQYRARDAPAAIAT